MVRARVLPGTGSRLPVGDAGAGGPGHPCRHHRQERSSHRRAEPSYRIPPPWCGGARLPLPPEHRASFEAFAAGVRAGVEMGGGRRAHEFTLLRTRPTSFEAADALGFLAFQAFALASNWDVELARLRMLALDGPDAVAALHPPYPEGQPVSDRPGEAAGRTIDALAADLAGAAGWFSPGGGSNNWAIAGSRTRSGRPLG